MKVLIATGVLGLVFHGSFPAFPVSPDASAAVTSARPGSVRHVSGSPAVLDAGQRRPGGLQSGHRLATGDQVRTRPGDRVEIVLSANSYLRVAGQARLEVLTADYPAMDFRLVDGEVVVDSARTREEHQVSTISTPAGDLRVVRPGFYRIRVHRKRPVGVTVFSGRVSWLGLGGAAIRVEPEQALFTGSLGGDSLPSAASTSMNGPHWIPGQRSAPLSS